MLQKLSQLSRRTKKLMLIVVDFLILYWALWSAFFIRLEEWWPKALAENWRIYALAPLLAIPAFNYLGLYNAVIRYIAPRFMFTIIKAVTIATLLYFVVVAMGQAEGTPRSTYLLYWVIATALIGGVRMVVRELLPNHGQEAGNLKKRVIVYGAGAAGTQTAKALQGSSEYAPVGFVDDNRDIQGWEILGIKVHPPEQLPVLIRKCRAEEIVLSLPSVSRARRKIILQNLEPLPITVKTLPSLPSILDGNVRIDDIRYVDIEDLLGRDPVEPIDTLIKAHITNKNVFVSGAGGSIGSELCRQIIRQNPAKLVLFELNEYALYEIERELRQLAPELAIHPVLGSVTNGARVQRIFASHGIETIYHAAAYKHVPIVEANLDVGVKNNIFGTLNLAQAAIAAKVDAFILISTDKAVRPANIMGATKRFAETILQGLAQTQDTTRFTMVRFGNVLGSSGSVVPLFRKQIREGGPVTVTHRDMTRYFMTIPEAAQLVLQAGAMGQGGDVFLLDMGQPVKIYDLASKMIQLSGLAVLNPETGKGDIAIDITGPRPGEKLYEELLIGEKSEETEHPRIRRAVEEFHPWHEVEAFLAGFRNALDAEDHEHIRRLLRRSVPGYQPTESKSQVAAETTTSVDKPAFLPEPAIDTP